MQLPKPVVNGGKKQGDPDGVEQGKFLATYTQILYHIVFGTKDHQGTLELARHKDLCRYAAGILRNKRCNVYEIGGYNDHLHILTAIHPSSALADVVKDVKLAAGQWIKNEKVFANFDGWQQGYGAFTCSWKDKDWIVKYIENQQEHHRVKTFREEYIDFLQMAGVEFDVEYLV